MSYDHNAPWLDRSMKLSSVFDGFLDPMAEEIAGKGKKQPKKDWVRNIKTALSVILANLLRVSALAPWSGLRIDLSNDGYPKNSYNPNQVGIRAIRKVVDALSESNPQLISKRGGNFDKDIKKGYPTNIEISKELYMNLMIYIRKKLLEINPFSIYLPITRNTFDDNIYFELNRLLFEKMDLPSIRVRKGSSKSNSDFMDFPKTNEFCLMDDFLLAYNNFLNDAVLNIFLDDKKLLNDFRLDRPKYDEFGRIDTDTGLLDLRSGNKLYRVFNDGTLDHGGRFYGGWWQHVPSAKRHLITINGSPTIEWDYSCMHLAMLYAKVGQQLEGDAYEIEGVPEGFRSLVKHATQKMINADKRMAPPMKEELPEGMSWNELREAITKKHQAIGKFFGSGEGIRLQRADSDIAEDVMKRMMERGIPVLPIHDSFIVPYANGDELSATMLDAYQQAMGGNTIVVKPSTTLFDELTMDQSQLTPAERQVIGLERFEELKSSRNFQSYRMREGLRSPREVSKSPTVRPVLRKGRRSPTTGPRASQTGFRHTWIPKGLKRLWDHSMRLVGAK